MYAQAAQIQLQQAIDTASQLRQQIIKLQNMVITETTDFPLAQKAGMHQIEDGAIRMAMISGEAVKELSLLQANMQVYVALFVETPYVHPRTGQLR